MVLHPCARLIQKTDPVTAMESNRYKKHKGQELPPDRLFSVVKKILAVAILLAGILSGLSARGEPDAGPLSLRGNAGTNANSVPAGTVLPVGLNHGFSSNDARPGQPITARIMQDVPLPGGGKIPEGAKVLGTILSVSTSGKASGAKISFRFNEIQIHRRRVAFVSSLRALAAPMDVAAALTPDLSPGFGTPYIWSTTRLIGGDVKYGAGGPVTDKWSHTVGQGTYDGVLVHLRPQLAGGCPGALDDDNRLQALWVFSADACGVYGITAVSIEHAGRSAPAGEITLAALTGDLKIRGGAGMLLRVP
jgi:hypothetical protein